MPDGSNGGGRAIALALGFALACTYEVHSDYTSEGCAPGSAGCPCAEDGGCEGALECVDGVCGVEPSGDTTTGATAVVTSTSSTSGADTGASAAPTGSTTGACEFICEADEPESAGACDLFAQDCPEGHKCAAFDMDGDGSWDDATCVEVTGDGQHGDPCTAEPGATGVDDCAAGMMCWNLDQDGVGACVAQCGGTPERPTCEPVNTTCKVCCDGVVILCLPSCDPLLQDCEGAELCVGDPNSDGFVCVLDASGEMAPEGTPCNQANACNSGHMCVNPNFYPNPACALELGCCAPFCDLSHGDDDCQGLSVEGVACVSYYEPGTAPPGFENVGLCGAP